MHLPLSINHHKKNFCGVFSALPCMVFYIAEVTGKLADKLADCFEPAAITTTTTITTVIIATIKITVTTAAISTLTTITAITITTTITVAIAIIATTPIVA
uniref:Uncharacterized protein n=2 Tax=Loa loa TaxID=7209 RepID=A0A1I7V6N6_LOALO